jgi:hypothetical protein
MLNEEGLKALSNHGNTVGEMARELLALRWTPITPKNLPKKDVHESLFRYRDGSWGVVDVKEEWPYERWIKRGHTHFRAMNPPPAPSVEGETK